MVYNGSAQYHRKQVNITFKFKERALARIFPYLNTVCIWPEVDDIRQSDCFVSCLAPEQQSVACMIDTPSINLVDNSSETA